MLIEKSEIRRLLPHGGAMCLVDGVEAWDTRSIVCVSSTHRSVSNPLRRDGRLSALHAFEYGAQAAAVHGGLLARSRGERAPFAYLGALKAGSLHVSRLDLLGDDLHTFAELLTGDRRGAIYQCQIEARQRVLAQARLTIVFVEKAER